MTPGLGWLLGLARACGLVGWRPQRRTVTLWLKLSALPRNVHRHQPALQLAPKCTGCVTSNKLWKKCTKLNWLALSLELHQIQLGCACNFSWTGDIASLGWAQGSLSVWSFNFKENFTLERFSIFVINCYFNTLSSTGTTTHIYLPLAYLVRCPPPYLDLGIYWWIGFSNLEISSIAAWNYQWYSEC